MPSSSNKPNRPRRPVDIEPIVTRSPDGQLRAYHPLIGNLTLGECALLVRLLEAQQEQREAVQLRKR